MKKPSKRRILDGWHGINTKAKPESLDHANPSKILRLDGFFMLYSYSNMTV